MKIAAYMVLKDDAYYVDMALKSIAPYVDGIYIQDQGSTDGSVEVVENFANNIDPYMHRSSIYIEHVNTNLPRFDSGYNEPLYRSMAVEKTEEIFQPDLILKIDADEIYTPYFFEKINGLEQSLMEGIYKGVRVSGHRFVSKSLIAGHISGVQMSPTGKKFYDPHTQIWDAKLKVRYKTNPDVPGFLHCVHVPDPKPVYWLEGICNIHLHRTFGPKSFDFWAEGGDKFKRKTPFNPSTVAPIWYGSEINHASAEKVDFVWPDYVIEKWEQFGIWD